jgi:hypothetical protein
MEEVMGSVYLTLQIVTPTKILINKIQVKG